jgi:flagellin-like protein
MEVYNNMKKKGLSPVIASVMMIMLVLVLAAMIFLWARGFISEQIEKFDKPIGDVCAEINFDAVLVGDNELEIINRGNVGIRSFDIKLIKGGTSEVAKFDFGGPQIDPGQAVKKQVTLLMDDNTEPDRIIIYPALLGSVRGKNANRPFTCVDAGKAI